jgi:hypothetical protein
VPQKHLLLVDRPADVYGTRYHPNTSIPFLSEEEFQLAGFSAIEAFNVQGPPFIEADAAKKQCGFIQARGRLIIPAHRFEVIV